MDGRDPEYVIRKYINPIDCKLPNLTYVDTLLSDVVAAGTGINESIRELSALGEALELDLIHFLEADYVGAYHVGSNFLDPAKFPENMECDGSRIEWVKVSDGVDGIRLAHRPTRNSGQPKLREHSSNGVAVHGSLQASVNSAFNEVLERHYLSLLFSSDAGTCVKSSGYELTQMDVILASKGFTVEFYKAEINAKYFSLCILQSNSIPFIDNAGIAVGSKVSEDPQTARIGSMCEALQVFEAAHLDTSELRSVTKNQRALLQGDFGTALNDFLLSKTHTGTTTLQEVGLGSPYYRSYLVENYFYSEAFVEGAMHMKNQQFCIGANSQIPWPL